MPAATHHTFTIERAFKASAARVFAAWSDPTQKRLWNACHDDWRCEHHALDFRPEGTELNRTVEPDGTVHLMKARYFDIVPGERIVYAYEMLLDETRISVSLVTVTFEALAARNTRMLFTEQVVFLDGHGDVAERQEGTEAGFELLAGMIHQQ
jgi:uncharacterized protein YndB with AHSA1/START domain